MARKKQEKSAGSPGRRGPKDRKPKVQRTVVRDSREREPDWEGEHDSVAGQYPFYRLDASTQHFKSLADVARRVEWIKGSYLWTRSSTEDDGCQSSGGSYIQRRQPFCTQSGWCSSFRSRYARDRPNARLRRNLCGPLVGERTVRLDFSRSVDARHRAYDSNG
jgi:hypothetical protein